MTNAQQAYLLAERIRMAVAAMRVPTESGEASVKLSIGISEMHGNVQTSSVEDLFRRADKSMYAAKLAGRNRTEVEE
jgi:diguanylate cyclase (GGDEF)-like protein